MVSFQFISKQTLQIETAQLFHSLSRMVKGTLLVYCFIIFKQNKIRKCKMSADKRSKNKGFLNIFIVVSPPTPMYVHRSDLPA